MTEEPKIDSYGIKSSMGTTRLKVLSICPGMI